MAISVLLQLAHRVAVPRIAPAMRRSSASALHAARHASRFFSSWTILPCRRSAKGPGRTIRVPRYVPLPIRSMDSTPLRRVADQGMSMKICHSGSSPVFTVALRRIFTSTVASASRPRRFRPWRGAVRALQAREGQTTLESGRQSRATIPVRASDTPDSNDSVTPPPDPLHAGCECTQREARPEAHDDAATSRTGIPLRQRPSVEPRLPVRSRSEACAREYGRSARLRRLRESAPRSHRADPPARPRVLIPDECRPESHMRNDGEATVDVGTVTGSGACPWRGRPARTRCPGTSSPRGRP